MFNTAKCPKCDQHITSVHFERHEANVLHGGSASYTATAHPCNHVMGAIPETWEGFLRNIIAQNEETQKRIAQLESTINHLEYVLKQQVRA